MTGPEYAELARTRKVLAMVAALYRSDVTMGDLRRDPPLPESSPSFWLIVAEWAGVRPPSDETVWMILDALGLPVPTEPEVTR